MTTATGTKIIIETPSDVVELLDQMQRAAKRWIVTDAPFQTHDHARSFHRLCEQLQCQINNFKRDIESDPEF